jgi:serine phosphatase RsbU (regulator of sigma subunit)
VSFTIREYSFFALSLLAAVWFFVAYPSQDPRSVAELSVDRSTIEQKASDWLKSMGHEVQNYDQHSRFKANRRLLDSLQTSFGRSEVIERLRGKEILNIEPYFWEVSLESQTSGEGEPVEPPGSSREDLKIHLDEDGNILEFVSPASILSTQKVNRSAIAAIFGASKDSAATILSTYSDTLLSRHMQIDLQRDWEQKEPQENRKLSQFNSELKEGRIYRLSKQDIFKMAQFYLGQTGWDSSELIADTVQLNRTNSVNTATATFNLSRPILEQELSLDVNFTATGALQRITSTYNQTSGGPDNDQGLWSVLRHALIILFVLGGVVLFFFRIRAGAIDTKPALVVSIVSGLAVSVMVLLFMIAELDVFSGNTQWSQNIQVLVMAGLAGAGSSLAFFVFFAIGDSINRQHWPQKLNIYDYLRQGMIFNKPIGFMLVRSVMTAFVLAGLWTLLLWLFPQFYFNIGNVFLHEITAWPPLHVALSNALVSLCIVLGIFLVLGGQTFAQTKNKLFSSILMVIACGIAVPFTGSFGPLFYEFIIAAGVGLAMVLIYLQWDFLTLFLSHFLFLGLIKTTSGWIVSGSMDTYIFVSLILLMAFLMGGGLVAIARGKEETVLSQYVPEYVEELAQEQRIRQELEIAREVQQSFLPIRTPEFDQLELAAICKPAYETGGDYYDFIPLDKNRVAVTIGDVSGKGIQAAFYMTFVKGILHSLCRELDSPAEILKKTNRLFWENAPRGTFISLVYGIVDLEEQTFHFARAGHNPVIRVNANNGSVEELQPKGLGIGLTKDYSFDQNIEEVKLDLSGDDLLILYTDGIVEALNENHIFYGTHRLNNLLNKNKQMSAAEILDLLSEDVRSFIGNAKQHDDMTMLIMKLKH